MDRAEIGRRLRAARKAARLSQERVAELLHTTKQTVSHWENGVTGVNLEDLQRLADLYGCSAADFLARSDSRAAASSSPRSGAPPDTDRLLTLLAEALHESQEVMRLRIEKVEAQQAEAQRMAQENIRRLMEYLPAVASPHAAGRVDEGAAEGTDG